MVGLDTCESHPVFIITLYNTQRAMSGSAQFKVKVMETIFPCPEGMLHGGEGVVLVGGGFDFDCG